MTGAAPASASLSPPSDERKDTPPHAAPAEQRELRQRQLLFK